MQTSDTVIARTPRRGDGGVVDGGPAPVARIDISLVVSTIGRLTELGRLLASVASEQADGPTVELIIVDQSADSAVLPLLESNDRPFRWVYMATASTGVSAGRNAGLALATGRYVMFPDDDAWLPGSTLAGVVGHLDRHLEHDGLCVQLQDARGRPSMLRWASTGRRVTKQNHHRTSIGSTMVFRTHVAQASGGFDERMGPGADGWLGSCEDADFLLRIIGGGRAVWYEPRLAVHHRDSRRDGGLEAERKALEYGCGQGHMWRSHGFPRTLVAVLLLRRFVGSLVWALRGRADIGRAHRAWGRGAINGLLDRAPADVAAFDDAQNGDHPSVADGPAHEGVDGAAGSGPPSGRIVAVSTIASAVAMAATSAAIVIAARRAGTGGVEAVVALAALAVVATTVVRGWLLGRDPGRDPAGSGAGRSRRASILVAATAGALAVTGDVWLGLLMLPGNGGARYGTAAVLSAQISLPAMLATAALAPRLARTLQARSLHDAGLVIRSVARRSLLAAAALAGAVAPIVAATSPVIDDGTAGFPMVASMVFLVAGDLLATVLAGASAVLWLTGRHRLAATPAVGWLLVSGLGAISATRLDGGFGLAVAGAAATAGLVVLWSAAAWVTTGLSTGPRLLTGIVTGWPHPRRRSRYDTGHLIPDGQTPIEPDTFPSITAPDLSLIVSTIGRPADFRRMIESIGRELTGGLEFELIVVDQSGEDETRRILEQADLPIPWRHVRSGRGLSLGRNLGLSLARGRYVTFPDDDVWYAGAMLAPAIARLDRSPNLAGVCARLATAEGSDSMLRWARTPKAVTHRNHHRTSIGPVMMMRRTVACRVGGFDETLGPGTGHWYGSCDDADFILRMIEDGESVWYDPDLSVHHRDPRLDGDPDTQRKSLAYGCGQGRMWRLHRFGRLWVALLLIRRLLGSVLMSLRGHPGVGRARRAWVRGALNGLADHQPVEFRPIEPAPAATADGPGDRRGPTGGSENDHQPTADEFIRGFSFRTAMSVIGMAATFVLTVISSRVLPDAELTRFYTLLASLAILPVISRIGLNTKAVQDLGTARGRGDWAAAGRQAHLFVKAGLVPSLLTGPLAAVVFVAWSSGDQFVTYAVLASVILVTESVRLTHSDILVGLGLPGWGAALAHQTRAIAVVAAVAADLRLLGSTMNLVRLLAIMATVGALLAAVGQIQLWRITGRGGAWPSLSAIAALIRAGGPFAVTDLAYTIIASGDIWLASKAFEPSTAALYSTASVLSKQIVAPIGLAGIALGPVAAGYIAQGRSVDLERIVRTVLSGLGLLLLPGLVGAVMAGDWILGRVYGDRFAAAHVPFAILLLGYGVVVIMGLSRTVLLMAGGQRLAMRLSVGWTAVIVPFGMAAAFFGGPVSLAVASAVGTAGLVMGQAAGAWIITGIRTSPSVHAVRDLLAHRDRLLQLVRGSRPSLPRSG